ncbi:neocarzinostatin apoprotein domain-containing protein [Streptomyces sp. NPDC056169]|uniref:neocarzinostatin apoprotein domain-containing protein n=1 Tax=Streptomyces sp. NPDC056169 TaxID=3345734 RepID=UPI0035E39CC3
MRPTRPTRPTEPTRWAGGPTRWTPAAAALLTALLTVLALALPPAAAATAAPGPVVELSQAEGGKGGTITVSGSGWKPGALLMLLICGQSAPGKGVIGGTNSCANSEGRAATVDARGAFSAKLPVAEPPKPCPCVVHVAGVTGQQDAVDKEFTVAGHPTAPLPEASGNGRLAVLASVRLDGSSGLLVWFGAPPSREVVFTVGNLGSAPVKDPVFEVGTSHGVFAPQYEERQWRGTIAPGKKALIRLPAELTAAAHGDYQVSVRYAGKVLVEQPWGVGRPWGVTLFWVLLAVVVPAALFRIGMAVVDRARPAAGRPAGHAAARLPRTAALRRRTRTSVPAPADADARDDEPTTALPWFSPDSAPSAPESSPTTKGHA